MNKVENNFFLRGVEEMMKITCSKLYGKKKFHIF